MKMSEELSELSAPLRNGSSFSWLGGGEDGWLALAAARWSRSVILIYKQFNLRNAAKWRTPNPAHSVLL